MKTRILPAVILVLCMAQVILLSCTRHTNHARSRKKILADSIRYYSKRLSSARFNTMHHYSLTHPLPKTGAERSNWDSAMAINTLKAKFIVLTDSGYLWDKRKNLFQHEYDSLQTAAP